MAHNAKQVHFECCNPILRVDDIARSLNFYVGKLGFKNADWGNEDFTLISRGGASIYLCRGGQGKGGAWVWVGVGDADALHRQLQSQQVNVRMEPKNFPWALEFHVEDPDGNVLRLGSEPRPEAGFKQL
jgi:catechol 2,3-dioxygenase-like lactoylglutathione lyase family enzyme